jgi:hypothetical protein
MRRRASLEDEAAASVLLGSAKDLPCAYCGTPMRYGSKTARPTRDHVWPKDVRSVTRGRNGTVWCCHLCNQRKGDMLPSEWLEVMRKEPSHSHQKAPQAPRARGDTAQGSTSN